MTLCTACCHGTLQIGHWLAQILWIKMVVSGVVVSGAAFLIVSRSNFRVFLKQALWIQGDEEKKPIYIFEICLRIVEDHYHMQKGN